MPNNALATARALVYHGDHGTLDDADLGRMGSELARRVIAEYGDRIPVDGDKEDPHG